MIKRVSYQDDDQESLINLTPLIDVVFVVLIAFILIAPLLEVEHINLASASGLAKKDLPAKSNLAIYVRSDNSIWINHRAVTINELTTFFKEKLKQNPSQIPQIFHDSKAHFGTYQSIKNALEKAGFKQMDIILSP